MKNRGKVFLIFLFVILFLYPSAQAFSDPDLLDHNGFTVKPLKALNNARVPSQEAGAPATAEPLDGTTHKILHAAVGAATGAILDPHHMGRGALAGAIGASVAEAVAEGLTAKGATAEEIQRNANAGRILAGIAALAAGQDVGISIHSGTTAVENNFLSKKEVLEAADNLLESVEEIDWVDVVETTETAIDVGTLGAALLTAPESAGLSLAAREGLKRYATKPAFCYMKKIAASSGGKQLTTGSVKYLRTFLRGLKQETKVSNVVKPKIKYSASEIKIPTVKESLKTSGRVDTGSGRVVKPSSRTPKIHGNDIKYVGDTHVYSIKNTETGQYVKIGESMKGLNKFGLSKRAESQARKLQFQTGVRHETQIRRTFENKAEARNWETKTIKKYRELYGQDKLLGNKGTR